ncbi:MAG: aminotransferase class I/II-fold pyridoxal phosphate-dependent enzyme [Candidatus Hodarchaeota archaeon]
MQAVILSAGFGTRLRPLTNSIPKGLIEVNNIPIIINSLNILTEHPLDRIIIVTGYLEEELKKAIGNYWNGVEITYVHNKVFATTNNIYSLWLVKDLLKSDTLLLECDIFFEKEVVKRIFAEKAKNLIVVSRIKPGMRGTVVEINKLGEVAKMYPSKDQTEDFDFSDKYKTVNIYWFKKDFLENIFIPTLDTYVKTQSLDRYYEIVLTMLIYLQNPTLYSLDVSDLKWIEVDSYEDLEQANIMFSPKELILETILNKHGGYWRYPFYDFSYLYNLYFPPDKLFEDLKYNLRFLLCNYPSAQLELIKKLSNWTRIETKYLAIGNGASEIINLLKDYIKKILIPIPTFNEYERNLSRDEIQYLDRDRKDFSLQNDNYVQICENDTEINTALIINPNNPTSQILKYNEIKNLVTRLSNIQSLDMIILDESFVDFAGEDISLSEEIDNYPKLIILRSLSKDLGTPGVRLGYITSANQNLINNVRKKIAIWNINSIAERILDILPKYRLEYYKSIELITKDRDYFYRRLMREVQGIKIFPSYTNYFFIELINGVKSKELRNKLFIEHDILIKDCSNKTGLEDEKYIRVAIRTKDDIDYFIPRFDKVLQELRKDND